MRRVDVSIAVVFAALGLLTMLWLVPTYVAGGLAGDGLSPAFMPYLAAGLATAAMVLLAATRLAAGAAVAEARPLTAASFVFISLAAAVLAAAFVLMESFGYVPGAAAVVAGFMLIVRANVRVVLAATVLFPAVLWLVFDELLGFPLP